MVIKILKLTKEQIDLAINLIEIKSTDVISDEQAQNAYKLYKGLHMKPNLNKGPDKVKPLKEVTKGNKVVLPVSVELFKTPERILYLTSWVIKVLPFIELLSGVGKLPLSRNDSDFEGYIDNVLAKYISVVKIIHEKIDKEYNLLQEIDLINIVGLSKAILKSLQHYYEGFPNTSYEVLDNTIETFLKPKGYLNHILTINDPSINKLYKMRTGSNHIYSRDEMFHIPFQLRGLVSTNRYSIPGLPCVYLGSSPLTCWEELNKPDLNTVQTSLFLVQGTSYLDFSTPPGAVIERLILTHQFFGIEDMQKTFEELTSYIVVWPLIAACSIKVKDASHTFKPEYVIPQLLLQWIRHSTFDGICYFSTKPDNYTMKSATLYRNYAFPVQSLQKEGHCSKLRDKMTITNAVPWQMFQLYKGTYLVSTNQETIDTELEFVDGLGLLYSATDFNLLETFLVNKLEKEQR
ncbi:hypothetical protein [Bacillus sp. FJAT-45066]|uniref:hypothetical protein n=1 Tax=Bacillus sp. FJAT-45066 TaxID=2011010 RepID=UPI0020D1CCD4|nr:hypothetical protein [Bacillus sp. FJAT-45066]